MRRAPQNSLAPRGRGLGRGGSHEHCSCIIRAEQYCLTGIVAALFLGTTPCARARTASVVRRRSIVADAQRESDAALSLSSLRLLVFLEKDKEQSHVIIGYRGLSLTDPDRFVLQTIQAILAGQGGRLFFELRDKSSLAYSISPLKMDHVCLKLFLKKLPPRTNLNRYSVWL